MLDESIEDALARRFASPPRPSDLPVSADEHRWMERVVAAARGAHPEFLAVSDAPHDVYSPRVLMFDENASVALQVGPASVEVIPLPDYQGEPARGFALMWTLCQTLAGDVGCVIVDPSDMTVIEMALDVDHAREEYGWL
jgi:hypothetical protein